MDRLPSAQVTRRATGKRLQLAIAHLGKAEHPLDDPDRMFDPHFREGRLLAALWTWRSFFRPPGLIHDTAVAVAAIGEIAGFGRMLSDPPRWPR
jgi:hypothetical protein